MDRRHLYALSDLDSRTVVGTFPTINAADRALKAAAGPAASTLAINNITHGSCPAWVREQAVELHGSSSAEAEVHVSETLVCITSSYKLSSKASAGLLETLELRPELLDEIRGAHGVTDISFDTSDPERVCVLVDMEVTHGGDSADPVRRGAYQAVMRVVLDAARFRWHVANGQREDPGVVVVATHADFVIVRDERRQTALLCWSDGSAHQTRGIDDPAMLKRLKSLRGITAADDRIALWAREEMSAAVAGRVPGA